MGKPGIRPGPIKRLCMEERLVEKLEEGWEEKLVEELEEERELVELLLHSQAGERTTYIQDYIDYIDCILRRLH